jgi:hypothetical protein
MAAVAQNIGKFVICKAKLHRQTKHLDRLARIARIVVVRALVVGWRACESVQHAVKERLGSKDAHSIARQHQQVEQTIACGAVAELAERNAEQLTNALQVSSIV